MKNPDPEGDRIHLLILKWSATRIEESFPIVFFFYILFDFWKKANSVANKIETETLLLVPKKTPIRIKFFLLSGDGNLLFPIQLFLCLYNIPDGGLEIKEDHVVF